MLSAKRFLSVIVWLLHCRRMKLMSLVWKRMTAVIACLCILASSSEIAHAQEGELLFVCQWSTTYSIVHLWGLSRMWYNNLGGFMFIRGGNLPPWATKPHWGPALHYRVLMLQEWCWYQIFGCFTEEMGLGDITVFLTGQAGSVRGGIDTTRETVERLKRWMYLFQCP